MEQILFSLKKYFSGKTKTQSIIFCLCIFFISLYCFSMWSFGSRTFWNYVNILICGLMLLLIIVYQLLYSDIRFDVFFVFLFIFCLIILISSAVNLVFDHINKTVFLMAIFGFGFYQFAREKENLKIAMLALLIGGTGFVLFYIFIYWKSLLSFNFSNRLGDYFDNQNEVAKNFVFLGIISLYLVFFKRKWFMLLYYLLMFYLLSSTGSISNLISFAFVSGIVVLFSVRPKNRIYVVLVFAFLAIIGFVIIQLPIFSYFKNRIYDIIITLSSGGDVASDASAGQRLEFALDSLSLFLSRPLFGFGFDSVRFFTLYPGSPAHNNFAELLGDLGIIGFLSFEIIIIYPFFVIMKNKEKNRFLFLSFLIYIFIFQFFLVTYYTKIEYLILSCSFGFISSNSNNWVSIRFRKFKGSITHHFSFNFYKSNKVTNKNSNISFDETII